MRNNKTKIASVGLIFVAMVTALFLFVNSILADDHHKLKGWFERAERDRLSIFDRHDEGNETAGQITAWLLVAANLPVVFSFLIKWT